MLQPDTTYHIYNCSNGDENLFREDKNYWYFLKKYFEYTNPVAETYAFCLLRNHFHAMIHIKSEEDIIKSMQFKNLSQDSSRVVKKVKHQFKNFFISYAKAFNKVYDRRGSLFNQNMKKKEVMSESYFIQLVKYIHNNPVKHGFVSNLYDWKYSSIHLYVNNRDKDLESFQNLKGLINTKLVLDWLGGTKGFIHAHNNIEKIQSVFE